MHVDVLIIGGGVIGCAIARQLTRYRLRVALLEREVEVGFGTSKANSGIIHGGHHAVSHRLKGRLEWAGNQLWDALCAELGFGFKRTGELTVALSPAELPILEHLLRNGETKGIPGLEIWDRERVLAAEPNLTPNVVAALYAPATGVVNPYEACFGLAESAVRNGLQLMTGSPVVGLAAVDDGWLVRTPHSAITARFVINAAGLYADRVADLAGGRTFSIHPRKGEEYLLDKRLCGLVQRVIFPCPTPVSKGILVIPTFDGTIMVGPTAHPTADREDRTTTAAGGDEVFAAVQQLVPGVSGRDCIDPVTTGPVVTSSMETSLDGVFACGNTVHIHDLVDFVSQEAALAGAAAGRYAMGQLPPPDNIRLTPGENVAYCVPQSAATERDQTVYLRVRKPLNGCRIRLSTPGGEHVYERKLRYVAPAEMVNLNVRPRFLQDFHGDALRIDIVADGVQAEITEQNG